MKGQLAITGAAQVSPPGAGLRIAQAGVPSRFSRSQLRRLSRLARLALPVVEEAMGEARLSVGPDVGLVVGTGLADLDETLSFLNGVHERGERFASPQNFQRSVHSSVAGELAILYGMTGFNLTVTQGLASGEAALWSAGLAVSAGHCTVAVAVAVDGLSDGLMAALSALGHAENQAGEGAAAVVVERTDALKGRRPLARLGQIDLRIAERARHAYPGRGAHGAQGLLEVVAALRGLDAPPRGVELLS